MIDRIIYPVHSLGPGNRAVIWTVGCMKTCNKCSNPELRAFDESKEMPSNVFSRSLRVLENRDLNGFTITGGEPFCQAKELADCLREMKRYSDDILIFSGYTSAELDGMALDNKYIDVCRSMAAVLVLGEYIDELNDNQTALIASSNQELIFVNDKYKNIYKKYIKKGRTIENILYGTNMISIGIHNNQEVVQGWQTEYPSGCEN